MAERNATQFQAYGAALESIQRRYGGLAAVQQFDFAPPAGFNNLLPADPERVFMAVINVGTAVVNIKPGFLATSLTGFVLAGSGGGVAFTERDDSLMPTLEWNEFCSAGGALLYVIAVRRDVQTNVIMPEV